MTRLRSTLRRIGLPRLALAIGLYAVFAVTDLNYRTIDNVYAMIEGMALLGLVTLGLSATMIAGELDFSVGSVAAVAGIIAIRVGGLGLLPAIAIAVLPAILFGALQGWVIARLRINSLVFTIGTMIALRGFAFIVSNEKSWTLPISDLYLSDIVVHRIGVFSPFSLTTIAVFVLVGLALSALRVGREIYAVGGGRDEAIGAGVSPVLPLTFAFTLSSGLAGLAGALAAIKSGSATPYAFDAVMLAGVTAALIGGVSLYGGKGSVIGIGLGVITLRLLIAGMASRGAPYYMETFATGVMLLIFLIIEFGATGLRSGRFRLPGSGDRLSRGEGVRATG